MVLKLRKLRSNSINFIANKLKNDRRTPMEKINALIDRLQELKQQNARLETLSYYTQLLYAEIMHARSEAKLQSTAPQAKVSVIFPGNSLQKERPSSEAPVVLPQEEQAAPVIPVTPQAAPAAEVQQAVPIPVQPAVIEMPAPSAEKAAAPQRTLFDVSPAASGVKSRQEAGREENRENTSSLQKEINETMAQESTSLNDLLKQERKELGHKLGESPVQDLRTAIGINDKFLFINELFRGDQDMYDRSLATINKAASLQDAEYWIERELKIKLGWLDRNEAVQQFYSLIRKRFSAI